MARVYGVRSRETNRHAGALTFSETSSHALRIPGAMRTPNHTTPRLLGGRYELDRVIAAGGMGTVHLARQIGAAGFSRVVAIKKPHPHFATQPELSAMFVDEAHLCARVQHPNVVQILDVVVEDGSVYVVMEYVHAESLYALCKHVAEGIPVPIACAIACAMLHGLHAAHEAKNELGEPLGIVHRDVSPHNVLVGADGVARVIDFGVAKAKERTQEQADDGKLKGKFSYIAPEQIRGAPQDRRIDVYAVAVTLWELLARRPLFRRDNDAATLNAVLGFVVPPPSTYNPEVDAALDAVVLKGLARDPQARWASAASMATALDSATPLASTNTIGAWVREHAPDSLRQRDARIQELEAEGSKSKRAAATSRKSLETAEPTTEITKVEVVPRISEPLGTPQRSTTLPSIEPARGALPTTRWLVIGAVLAACAGGVAFSLRRSTEQPMAEEPAPPVSAAPAVSAPLPPPRCPAEMQEIEGGQFFMGSDEHLPSERPAHPVTLAAYCIDRHQVTSA